MTHRPDHAPLRLPLAVGLAVLAAAPVAHAQSIERNLPPAREGAPSSLVQPNALPSDQDATPIGPALRAVVTLGAAHRPIAVTTVDGIDLSRTPRLRGSQDRLARFLGRPLSRKLIAEIEAEIAGRYRALNLPFVSLSTPEQEITAGVLQIRVVEFHLAAKTAPGASPKDGPYIESRVRVERGEPVDAALLGQDLDWLNRYPFRRTQAVFSPGPTLGDTDLGLQTAELKPWSVYAGYANSGSPQTGSDRYFAGVQAALPFLHDAYASYQFTGSKDVVFNEHRPFSSAADPAYASHAGRLVIPTLPRQAIEASVSYVRSNQLVQDFLIRQTSYEGALDYRSALSNLWRPLSGDAAVGVEVKRQVSRTVFGGVEVAGASFDIFQATLAYAGRSADRFGRSAGAFVLHLSPGGVGGRNNDAAFSFFSRGRSTEAEYAYLSFSLDRSTNLPPLFGVRGFSLTHALIGQYAARALPLTEQIGLGDHSLVRGYTLDDGAFDSGFIVRNELRSPAVPLLSRTFPIRDQLAPFLFLDAGYGRSQRSKADAAPVSTGLGADYQLADHLTATLDGAVALRTVSFTRSGDVRLEARVTLTF